MRSILIGTLAFAFAAFGLGMGLSTISALQHGAGGVSSSNNGLMAFYLALVPGALSTLGFILVTALSASWRTQNLPFVLLAGVSLGLLASFLQFSGLAFLPVSLLLPSALLRAWPKASAFVVFACPGILAGVIAVFVARVRSAQRAVV